MMTLAQETALWELSRQGHQLDALDAESAWRAGRLFDSCLIVGVTPLERAAVDVANYEIETEAGEMTIRS